MENTTLKTTKSNLAKLVGRTATPATIELINTELQDCKTLSAQIDWMMECYYTFEQEYTIVKIVETGTWGLVTDEEITDLWNENTIKYWHE